jgi:peptidoglycan/LPS O-acetylase OafA/YrhL
MEIMNYLRAQWDRVIGVVALLVGILALVLGYFGVSGTPHVAAQLPYFISGGLFGLFMLGVACMTWLSADLRDEWRELRAIRRLLETGVDGEFSAQSGATNGFDVHPELGNDDSARLVGSFSESSSREGASSR